VLYPGGMEVHVRLSPGDLTFCVTSDTSCTGNLARNSFNITYTQINDIGLTVDHHTIDTRVLVVEEQVLRFDTKTFNVVVRRNAYCPESLSPVLVTFGSTRAVAGGQCEGQQNATEMVISSGDSASFHVSAGDISLGPGETICFIVSLDGVPVIYGTSGVSTDVSSCETSGLSVGLAAGIAVLLSLLVVLPVGVVIGCCGMWCLMRKKGGYSPSGGEGEKERELAEDVYEEPVAAGPGETAFSVSDNQAYGQFTSRPGGR
jgi:hypothetical protein